MTIVPRPEAEMLQFYEARGPMWVADPPAIGLTLSQMQAMGTAIANARTKFDAAYNAQIAARSATQEKLEALAELRTLGGQLINVIRAFAISSEDPEVYTAAGLPAPKTPEPINPVNPSDVTFRLDNSGAVEVRWKGLKVGGTMFTIWRSVTPGPGQAATPLTPLASVGERKFVDTTVPAGATNATYVIRALKGNEVTGGSSPATVNFIYTLNNGQQQLQIAA